MLVLVVLAMQPRFIAADTLEALLISRYPCYYPTGGTSSDTSCTCTAIDISDDSATGTIPSALIMCTYLTEL